MKALPRKLLALQPYHGKGGRRGIADGLNPMRSIQVDGGSQFRAGFKDACHRNARSSMACAGSRHMGLAGFGWPVFAKVFHWGEQIQGVVERVFEGANDSSRIELKGKYPLHTPSFSVGVKKTGRAAKGSAFSRGFLSRNRRKGAEARIFGG